MQDQRIPIESGPSLIFIGAYLWSRPRIRQPGEMQATKVINLWLLSVAAPPPPPPPQEHFFFDEDRGFSFPKTTLMSKLSLCTLLRCKAISINFH